MSLIRFRLAAPMACAALWLALAVLALAPDASAQAPVTRPLSTAEMTSRILALEASTADAEQLRQDNARLRLEMRDLQGQLSASNGKVERLEFELAQAREELEALQRDNREIGKQLGEINERLDGLSSGFGHAGAASDPTFGAGPGSAGAAGAAQGSPTATPGGGSLDLGAVPGDPAGAGTVADAAASPAAPDLPEDPQALFEFGKARLVQFDYAGAEAAFSAFLDSHGDHERASEAQYWLGEVQYQLEDYRASGATYTAMIRNHPEDPRAADALVKLARSMRLVGETEKACAALGAIDRRYPNASAVTRNLANLERTKAQCGG